MSMREFMDTMTRGSFNRDEKAELPQRAPGTFPYAPGPAHLQMCLVVLLPCRFE